MSQYLEGFEAFTEIIRQLSVAEDAIDGRLIAFFRRYHELSHVALPEFVSQRLSQIEISVNYPNYEAFIAEENNSNLRYIAEQIFQAHYEFNQTLLS